MRISELSKAMRNVNIITHVDTRAERTVIFCDPDPILIFFKTQSKSKHSPKIVSNGKSKFKCSQMFEKSAFPQQKCPISFPLTKPKSGPDHNFEEFNSLDPIQIQQNLQ